MKKIILMYCIGAIMAIPFTLQAQNPSSNHFYVKWLRETSSVLITSDWGSTMVSYPMVIKNMAGITISKGFFSGPYETVTLHLTKAMYEITIGSYRTVFAVN